MSDARHFPGASFYKDRHGKNRWRFRMGGFNCKLPGEPGDAAFQQAYDLAIHGARPERSILRVKDRPQRIESMVKTIAQSSVAKARCRARIKKVPFSLQVIDVEHLLCEQGYACAISGISFLGVRPEKPFRPSLDRIVPCKGYVAGNVRIVCEIVNMALSNWGEGPLLRLAACITEKGAATQLANQDG